MMFLDVSTIMIRATPNTQPRARRVIRAGFNPLASANGANRPAGLQFNNPADPSGGFL
jgi:hypothetical protein